MNICEWCGNCYTPKRRRAVLRWCSNQCKNEAKTARIRDQWLSRAAERACESCGGSLAGRRTDTKWCSDACSQRRPTRPAVARRARLKIKYGITEAEYDALVVTQNGTCGICQSPDPKHASGKWHIDHDHVTGAVRGLLCSRCNTGIGQLQDDPRIMRAAAEYVEAHAMAGSA